MKVLIKIMKFIAITILTICMIFIGIKTIVSSTILEQEYVKSKLEETNFYAETYKLAKSNFENYIYQSGLDEVVLENICTEEKVKNDINIIIKNIYEGTNTQIDTTEISNNLNSNIDKLGVRTSKNQQAIEQFVAHICDEYTDTILHTKYEDNINNKYTKVTKTLDKIYNITLIVLVIDIIVLVVVNIKEISKFLQNIGIALFSTSIFELIVCSTINSKVNIDGIKVFNDTFSKTIVTIIKNILNQVISLAMGILVIAVIVIATYSTIVFVKTSKIKDKEEYIDK